MSVCLCLYCCLSPVSNISASACLLLYVCSLPAVVSKRYIIKSFTESKFLTALSQDGALNEEGLSTDQLDAVFGPLRQEVTENIRSQEQILQQIQVELMNRW